MSTKGKAELRVSALNARRMLRKDQILALSDTVAGRVFELPEFMGARTVECYVALKDEIQTKKIIGRALRQKKRVIVPITNLRTRKLSFSEIHRLSELVPGYFGVLEPRKEYIRRVPLERAQLAIIPLIAWDKRGYRLGYGRGFFDNTLNSLKRHVTTVGLGLESQQLDEIPQTPNDARLDIVVTEKRTLRMRPAHQRMA